MNELMAELESLKSTETQNNQILAYLKSGKTITDLEAYDMFECRRLSARIYDLRERGIDIRTTMETHKVIGRRAKRYARYWMPKAM